VVMAGDTTAQSCHTCSESTTSGYFLMTNTLSGFSTVRSEHSMYIHIYYLWYVLVSEPDPSQEEEGSGHSPTFELSPGQNVDLANQNR